MLIDYPPSLTKRIERDENGRVFYVRIYHCFGVSVRVCRELNKNDRDGLEGQVELIEAKEDLILQD